MAVQSIRGMNDLFPPDIFYWQHVESILKQVMQQFAYQEIRTPILEHTELFKRSIGDATDIVEKEMYTFLDRNSESLTLRPEGTACVVRAGIERGLLYHQQQRYWYLGPMFRHERPQKGRYRQFHQFGIEFFGVPSFDADCEVMMISYHILSCLSLDKRYTLNINSLGTTKTRARYREALLAFLMPHSDKLDPDSQRRLTSNPFRILDSKNPLTQQLLDEGPVISDFLEAEEKKQFEDLCQYLKSVNIPYVINPKLVRGLDYYNHVVFEWVSQAENKAQNTVCAGGRYDGLVAQLGGEDSPAVGFALGVERLVEEFRHLQNQETEAFTHANQADIYLTAMLSSPIPTLRLSQALREALPHLKILMHCGGGQLKKQLKRADQSGAKVAILFSEPEGEAASSFSITDLFNRKMIKLKFLREQSTEEDRVCQQENFNNLMELVAQIKKYF